VFLANLATGESTPVSFADADLDSANLIMTVPLAALGLAPTQQFRFDVVAFGNYFTFQETDAVRGMLFTPATPKFTTDGLITGTVAAGGDFPISVDDDPAGNAASPSQSGLLLLHRDAATEAETIDVSVRGPAGS
jgi:hypothetical protein